MVMAASAMWSRLFTEPPDWRHVLLAVLPTMLVAWMAGRWARRTVAGIMRNLLSGTVSTASPFVRAPLRLIGFATFLLGFAVLIFPAFEIAGLHPRTGVHLRTLNTWAFDSGIRVVLLAAVPVALIRPLLCAVPRV